MRDIATTDLLNVVQSYTVLTEVVEQLNELVPDDFVWAVRNIPLNDTNEEAAGIIQLDTTKSLFVLSLKLAQRAKRFELESQEAMDDINEEELYQKFILFRHLSDVIMSLFWFQCRSELGLWRPTLMAIKKDISNNWQVIYNDLD